jgi:predicted ATP-grasp superfamily ATP-dependent carboligase/protein-tyrosine-phosphatase
MKILVTDGEQRAALAVTRSLGKMGHEVIVASEHRRTVSSCSRYSEGSFVCHSPVFDEGEFVEEIKRIVNTEEIDLVIPITDLSMLILLDPQHALSPDVIYPFPSYEQFSFVSDKVRLVRLCQQLNVNVPKTIFLESAYDLDRWKGSLSYPVIIKPYRSVIKVAGRWFGGRVKMARDYDELMTICDHDIIYRYPFMLQEVVEGEGRGIFTLYRKGKPVDWFAHRRIREKPPEGGVSVLSASISPHGTMLDAAKKVLDHVKWHGPAMVEFKYDAAADAYYLMEINGRFWGSLQLAVKAGVDFPSLLLRDDAAGVAGRYREDIRLRWFLGDLDHHLSLLRRCQGIRERIKVLRSFLLSARKGITYDVMQTNDMLPLCCEVFSYVTNIFTVIKNTINGKAGRWKKAWRTWCLERVRKINLFRRFLLRRIPKKAKSVLFVCQGNIYRSSFAEHYTREHMGTDLIVDSIGVNTLDGAPVTIGSEKMAAIHGVDLSKHHLKSSARIKGKRFDVVFVMERDQKKEVREFGDVILELGLMNDGNAMTYDIPDPMGKTENEMRRIYHEMLTPLQNVQKIINPEK